jgi:hypothetical protein
MSITILDDDGIKRQADGQVVSRTAGLLGVARLNGQYVVTHLPTGCGVKVFEDKKLAMRRARVLYRDLDKEGRKLLASDVPLVVQQLRTNFAMRTFLDES